MSIEATDENLQAFFSYALEALNSQFNSREELDKYYAALTSDEVRRDFLRTASFYLFLIKRGDWFTYYGDERKVVSYLTETYKVVALFSLIESVSGEKYQDFYDWLIQTNNFPIVEPNHLTALHTEYKQTFGSIRRCVWFFQQMPKERQEALCSGVRVDGKPSKSIEHLAKYLYQLRSSFVHNAELVLQLSEGVLVSLQGNKILICAVTLNNLTDAFEECIVKVFRDRT